MKKQLILLLAIVLLTQATPVSAGMVDPKLKWKTIDTKHFSINYEEGKEAVAEKVARISEDVYETLSKTFDAYPKGRTEVVLTDHHDSANGFTTVIPYNHVILRLVPPTADSTLADYDEWIRELFVHEYTHVIHISDTRYPAKLLKGIFGKLVAPNGTSPGWVTEGIATYFETAKSPKGGRGDAAFTEMLIRTDVLQNKLLKLDQMAGFQYDWPSWMSQYLYGAAFWKYLADKYGEDKIAEFSHKYGASLRFFMLNSQAKRVFRKEWSEDIRNLCDKDHWQERGTWKVKETYPEVCGEDRGQSFYKLWAEWQSDLTSRYSAVKDKIEKEGHVEGDVLLAPRKGESFTLPTLSPDGKSLAYLATSVHRPKELRLRDLETGTERVLLKKKDAQSISFSRDGQKLLVSNIGSYKRYYSFSDIHEISLDKGGSKQLTKGKRARDPDESPDGKMIAAVIQGTGSACLGVYDREKKKWDIVFPKAQSAVEGEAPCGSATGGGDASPYDVQLDQPKWLSDGKSIVVSIHEGGQRDLWIVDTQTSSRKRLTNNAAIESNPELDPSGQAIYYTSDANGIPNVYRQDLKSGKASRVTNVLTGAMAPSPGSDGSVYFQHYNGSGFEISKVASGSKAVPTHDSAGEVYRGFEIKRSADSPGNGGLSTDALSSHDYHPFKRLFVPRYLMPNVALIDGSVFASATITGNDPLYRHNWFIDGTYRSDNNFLGYDAGYTYNRYRVPLSVGFSDFSVNYGDVFGFGTDFFEERRRAYAGFSVPVSSHRFSLNYFFERRTEQSGLPAGAILSTLGNYAGIHFRYAWSKSEGTAARISPVEKGSSFRLNYEMTDHVLGASNQLEQQVIWGDARTYIKMPYADHHVLALRAAGGAAFGDQLLQGNFGLGGSLGESPFSGSSTRVFTLRGMPLGTFSRDRAWVASAEYRMPLFRTQRGIGTLPFALNSAHLAVFADVGDAFNPGNPSFRPMLGVGAELRGDFVLGYYLPVMGRLGYGIIVTHRERITGVPDSLTGWDSRNGALILEVGTSY